MLLTHDLPEHCGATLKEGDARRECTEGGSPPLGEALRDLKVSYHFAASRGEGWSLEPYRCGVGGFLRLARLHALPARGRPKALRAFSVDAWAPATDDIDTEDGARAAALRAQELRAASANPYVFAAARAMRGAARKHVPRFAPGFDPLLRRPIRPVCPIVRPSRRPVRPSLRISTRHPAAGPRPRPRRVLKTMSALRKND